MSVIAPRKIEQIDRFDESVVTYSAISVSQQPSDGGTIQAPHVPRTPHRLNAMSEVALAQLYLLGRDRYRIARCEE